ncbi:MAG: integrase core domain-containing protein [Pseudoclavibacter sp.]
MCWDNAMAESVLGHAEDRVLRSAVMADSPEARREVARWIEIVYNRRRLHSSLDYTSPVAFEKMIKRDQADTEEHTQIRPKQLDHTSTSPKSERLRVTAPVGYTQK